MKLGDTQFYGEFVKSCVFEYMADFIQTKTNGLFLPNNQFFVSIMRKTNTQIVFGTYIYIFHGIIGNAKFNNILIGIFLMYPILKHDAVVTNSYIFPRLFM